MKIVETNVIYEGLKFYDHQSRVLEIPSWEEYCNLYRTYNCEAVRDEDVKYIGRYCRKHDINIDHIFAINVVGDLVPKRLMEGNMNADRIVNSHDGTLAEWEIKYNIKEIRSELNKSKAETEFNLEWIGEWE